MHILVILVPFRRSGGRPFSSIRSSVVASPPRRAGSTRMQAQTTSSRPWCVKIKRGLESVILWFACFNQGERCENCNSESFPSFTNNRLTLPSIFSGPYALPGARVCQAPCSHCAKGGHAAPPPHVREEKMTQHVFERRCCFTILVIHAVFQHN